MNRLNRLTRWLCATALATSCAMASAQTFPARPIRLVVPFPPGGSADLIARTIAPRFGELLGQPVVIDYRAGAGGSIGTTEVARAAPDGHTLVMVWDTHAVNHHLYKVQYDYLKSFEPITLLVQAAGILVANPDFPPATVGELVAYAKANPGKVTYGSAGAGSSNHLSAVLFDEMTGISMTHVPYKGGGPLITDLLGGHLNIAFGTMPLFEQYVRTGKMKAIAVLSKARNPQYPKLPAAAETVPGFEASTWFGLLAPAGTPRDVVARLHAEIVRTLADDKTREQLASRGFEVVGSTPDALATFMQQQSQASARLVRSAGIKLE